MKVDWKPFDTLPNVAGQYLVWSPDTHKDNGFGILTLKTISSGKLLKVLDGVFLFDHTKKPTLWAELPDKPDM